MKVTTNLPTFHLVGAARSGTTGLVEGLRGQPRVFVTTPKEPHFFALHDQEVAFQGPGDAHTINQVAVTRTADYLSLFPTEHSYLALGEGSVSSLYYFERAIPRALSMNPDMKFIVLLREPVARAFSSHQYLKSRGFEPVADFVEAVAQEEARKAENWHHLWHYTSMSMYADSIGALREMVPEDQLGIWFHDDLERDYVGTLQEVLRFLGVPAGEADILDVPRVNISGEPRLKRLQQAIVWTTRHPRLRAGVKRFTSYRLRELIRRRSLARGEVPRDVMEKFGPLFEDDLRKLSQVLPEGLATPTWVPATQKKPH